MAVLSCLCKRNVSIHRIPTKQRSGFRDPAPILRKFLRPHRFSPEPIAWKKAVANVEQYLISLFSNNVRPYHFRDRLDDISKNTSPGRYWKLKGCKTKKEVIEQHAHKLRVTCHKVKTGKIRDTNVFVTQVVVADAKEEYGGGEVKARVAWVYPIEVTSMENMFYAAFSDYIPDDWVPTPASHHDLWCNANSRSFDFSNFDASVSDTLIRIAFELLYNRMNFCSYQGGAIPKSKTSLRRLWRFLVRYFIHTPYCISNDVDTIRQKHHGVPSGSMFTNLIDTIVSRLVLEYLHLVHGCEADTTTYGDDAHSRYCSCNQGDLETRAMEDFGMKLKVEKPNEHGCLTYCKAECHLGQPFHDGQWFRNILNCTPFYKETIDCLLCMEPTKSQYNELKTQQRTAKPSYPGEWLRKWKDKVQEFWPKFKHKWSSL